METEVIYILNLLKEPRVQNVKIFKKGAEFVIYINDDLVPLKMDMKGMVR